MAWFVCHCSHLWILDVTNIEVVVPLEFDMWISHQRSFREGSSEFWDKFYLHSSISHSLLVFFSHCVSRICLSWVFKLFITNPSTHPLSISSVHLMCVFRTQETPYRGGECKIPDFGEIHTSGGTGEWLFLANSYTTGALGFASVSSQNNWQPRPFCQRNKPNWTFLEHIGLKMPQFPQNSRPTLVFGSPIDWKTILDCQLFGEQKLQGAFSKRPIIWVVQTFQQNISLWFSNWLENHPFWMGIQLENTKCRQCFPNVPWVPTVIKTPINTSVPALISDAAD
jgi:hypothetical protein